MLSLHASTARLGSFKTRQGPYSAQTARLGSTVRLCPLLVHLSCLHCRPPFGLLFSLMDTILAVRIHLSIHIRTTIPTLSRITILSETPCGSVRNARLAFSKTALGRQLASRALLASFKGRVLQLGALTVAQGSTTRTLTLPLRVYNVPKGRIQFLLSRFVPRSYASKD